MTPIPSAPEILAGRQPTVISAHFDDGVLSCGALLAACADAGAEATVVTVFSGAPEAPLSDVARSFHRTCGLPDDDAMTARRQEDDSAMKAVGARPVRLGALDALYRKDSSGNHRYLRDEELSRARLDTETEVVNLVSRLLADEPAVRDAEILMAPLAIGNHIDHRITRAAVWALDRPADSVLWYEDVPYQLFPPELRQPIDESPAGAEVFDATEQQWKRKLQGIECYASQTPHLLGEVSAMLPQFLTMYGEGIGNGAPAERYWRSCSPTMP